MTAIRPLISLLMMVFTSSNLLFGGITTDQETIDPCCQSGSVNDGNLIDPIYYHSNGNQANNWLDIQTATFNTINTILLVTAD